MALLRLSLVAVLTAVALAGCTERSGPDPVASSSAAVADQSPAHEPVSPAAPAPATAPVPAQPSASASSPAIPLAMRGRFGLVPADCVTTRGDDKGLITLTAGRIRFYESVARLVEVREQERDRLRGRFAYSGEGMEWSRDAALALKDGGRTLILQEFGEDAVPGPQTFTRCPA